MSYTKFLKNILSDEPLKKKSNDPKVDEYYRTLKDSVTSSSGIEALSHKILIDICLARDYGDEELENQLMGVLIYFLADERLKDHSKIYSRIRALF